MTDEQARPGALILPTECLNALLMTLPDIVKRSLQQRFPDQAMRVVYPVGSWEVEGGSPPGTVIATLRTPDGFEVSFALPALELLRMASQGASASAEASGVINN